MIGASLYRILKFSNQDFWRNIWLSVITITILVFTFFSISFLVMLNIVSNSALKAVENKVDISVYFKPEASDNEILSLKSYLSSLPEAKEIIYINKDEALQKFKDAHVDDPVIQKSLEELGRNPLTASFIIKAKNIDDYPKILEQLDKSEYSSIIESKNFQTHKDLINQISAIFKKVKMVGIGVTLIFVIIACLIVFNSVRIMIYTHREEIGIMKLVGASDSFVKGPYFMQSIIYSIIACLITIALLYPLMNLIQPYLKEFFSISDFNLLDYFNGHIIEIFGLQLLLIAVLTLISTSIAIKRYLKV